VGALTILRFGWAGYVVTTEGGTRIVVDPYLHGSQEGHSGLPESPFTVDDLAGADVVAVTHAGYDHRAQAIDIALAGSAVLVSGTALYGAALDSGLPAERCAGMVPGMTFRHGDATLKAIDAGRHTSNMVWKGQFVSDEPMSFLLATEAGSRIFCGGDSAISGDFKTWRELYAPQVAILGIGGVQHGPVSTTWLPPAEAAIAADWLGAPRVIPVHYPPGDPAPSELISALAARGSGIEVTTLEFGQTWTQPVRR
jgi:L-ascorbate metabolism protein UlaG (beta-lactamase superfamily)